MRRNVADEENKLKAELLQLQSSAAEKTGGSEDSIAQMNASLVRVLSELKGSQFVEEHAVAESLSVECLEWLNWLAMQRSPR